MEKEKIIWKDIPGYEKRYQINQFGIVKSLNYANMNIEKNLSFHKTKLGYIRITLSKNGKMKKFYIHRLVAQVFIFNPKNRLEINHKDGNKENNYYKNLEWCTHKQHINIYHSNLKKTSKYIRKYGISIEKLAKKYNRCKGTILYHIKKKDLKEYIKNLKIKNNYDIFKHNGY